MPNENQNDPTKNFAVRGLPWISGAVMFVIYLATLNRWVTLANILPVSKISGFLWQPEFYNPLTYLATLPFRLLPAAQVPLALNIFSAALAAVTLGLLARCVAILPHDRTEMERTREKSDYAFLTTGSAWFPPLLAVVMFGLQFGFWENATSFTGEMVDLLVFTVILWQLLEYRLDEKIGRLYLAAAIYGAGLTSNWALVGFLPVFVAAIIWQRRLEFFNAGFLLRMSLAWAGGLLFFFLLPVVGKISGVPLSFWQMLKPAVRMDWLVVKAVQYGELRHNLILMSVTTLVPILVMAIRWSPNFGDASRVGTALTSRMVHLIHAVIFTVCIWVMFDPPFSPGQLAAGTPALTMYLLSALAIGYFCGYYLLVFGKKAIPSRRNPMPDPALPQSFQFFTPVIYWGVYVAAAIVLGTLLYKNLPQIRSVNDDTLLRYAKYTEETLPADGAIVLSDPEGFSSSGQTRTLLIKAALARSGRAKKFLVADSASLNWAGYHRFLHKESPQKWPQIFKDQDNGNVSPFGILGALNLLSQSNNICYLNPSFGYYFEMFYQEPHGLVYDLKKIPEVTLLPPPLSSNLLAENRQFWARLMANEVERLTNAMVAYNPVDHLDGMSKPGWYPNFLLMHLHSSSDINPNVVFAANLYSRALDFWGVQELRAGQSAAASEYFTAAKALNPDNETASINLEFNRSLQAGTPFEINPARADADQFGKYRDWNSVLNGNGPFAEPSFVFANAALLAQGGYSRQAIAQFTRVRQLAPENLPARLWLAQLYLLNRLPAPALEALKEPLAQPGRYGLYPTNSTELNVLAAAAYFQTNDVANGTHLLELELDRHPEDNALFTSVAQAYFLHGLYTNALQVIDRRLTQLPDDPQWLFGKGYAFLQMSNYNQAITAFTRVIQVTTNDPTARFNRALAYLQAGQLGNARTDYAALQNAYTNSFQVAFGLGEVAWRQHNTNEAVRNYQIFLANAPTNTVELGTVRQRLKQLQKN
jgi:tetratricopeptide (TPR) repeat protein